MKIIGGHSSNKLLIETFFGCWPATKTHPVHLMTLSPNPQYMKTFETAADPLPSPPFLFSIIFANTPPPHPSVSQHPLWSTLRFLSTLKPKSWMESLFFIPLDCRMEEGGGGRVTGDQHHRHTLSLPLSLSVELALPFSRSFWSSRCRSEHDRWGLLRKYRKGLVWFGNREAFQIQSCLWVCLHLVSGFKAPLHVFNMYHLLSNVCSFLLWYCPFDQWHFIAHTKHRPHVNATTNSHYLSIRGCYNNLSYPLCLWHVSPAYI